MLEDLDQIKVDPEQYDTELEMALKKARKLKQKEATEALANPEKVSCVKLAYFLWFDMWWWILEKGTTDKSWSSALRFICGRHIRPN